MPELTFIVQTKQKSSTQEQARSLSHVRYHAAKATQRRRYAETVAAAEGTRRTQSGASVDKQPSPNTQFGRQSIIAYKGNSDPFATSCGVDVTPRITEVLNYIVDVYLPTTYPAGKSWIREHSTELFFRDQTRVILSSPIASCSMLPFLSILATTAGGERQSDCLSIQLLIMKNTREAIGSATSNHEQLLFQIKALFSCAVAEHSWSAARSHGAILNNLLQQVIEREGWAAKHQKFVINLLFFVLNMTQMTLRKSIVDVGMWFDQCLQETSQPVLDYLEPLHEWFENRIDIAVSDEHLRRLYRDLYETIWVWYRQDQPSPNITQYALNQFCRMQHNALSCRLINLYAQFKNELKSALSPEREAFLVSQAVLALSLPAFMATFVYSPRVGSHYIWKRYPVLLAELRVLLSRKPRSESFAGGAEYTSMSQNVLLWAYWVGATWEHSDAELRAGSTSPWFTERFVELCQATGLDRWTQVGECLAGFALVKFAKPPGSQWVDSLLFSTA